jgi:hypothetical protein
VASPASSERVTEEVIEDVWACAGTKTDLGKSTILPAKDADSRVETCNAYRGVTTTLGANVPEVAAFIPSWPPTLMLGIEAKVFDTAPPKTSTLFVLNIGVLVELEEIAGVKLNA